MRKVIPYSESLSDESLIQLIGESETHESESLFTKKENEIFLRNGKLCALLNDIEFTIESYGIINFLIDYDDQISDLRELGSLLKDFGHIQSSDAIQKVLHFYEVNLEQFSYLRTNPSDFDERYSQLELELNGFSKIGIFSIPLHASISSIANHIRENKSDFFSDEHNI